MNELLRNVENTFCNGSFSFVISDFTFQFILLWQEHRLYFSIR